MLAILILFINSDKLCAIHAGVASIDIFKHYSSTVHLQENDMGSNKNSYHLYRPDEHSDCVEQRKSVRV